MASFSVCYHVAPVACRPEIEAAGLHASAPEGGYPSGVYLFVDYGNATFFAMHMSERDRDEYGIFDEGREIWLVSSDGLELHPDPAISADDDFQQEYPRQPLRSFYSPVAIPCSRLQRDPELNG